MTSQYPSTASGLLQPSPWLNRPCPGQAALPSPELMEEKCHLRMAHIQKVPVLFRRQERGCREEGAHQWRKQSCWSGVQGDPGLFCLQPLGSAPLALSQRCLLPGKDLSDQLGVSKPPVALRELPCIQALRECDQVRRHKCPTPPIIC